MSARRAHNLAQLLGTLLASSSLSIFHVLKPVDLPQLVGSSPSALLFFKAALAKFIIASAEPGSKKSRDPSSARDPVGASCASLGANQETLIVRDHVAVFLTQHLRSAPAGLPVADVLAFDAGRKRFKRGLRDAQRLFESARVAKKPRGNERGAFTDIDGANPDDEWAAFYGVTK
mmetsp:Transcript_13558/g.32106  ORF Transcript_13558/g.32106 Transcript_13558/m.32106 type:complete len:175 (-) Transcript_13558:229-753(-)